MKIRKNEKKNVANMQRRMRYSFELFIPSSLSSPRETLLDKVDMAFCLSISADASDIIT